MQIHIDEYERRWIITITVVLGVFFASLLAGAALFGVRAPDQGTTINPNRIDETMFANPGLRHMGDNRYEAVILAQMWSFTPNEIRVPEGAEVTFYVTSQDITHGFLIEHHNVNLQLVPGHVAQGRVHFKEAGTYKMLCHEYCGRGHQIMYADIIVEEAEAEVATSGE